jgi:hypothetical protein
MAKQQAAFSREAKIDPKFQGVEDEMAEIMELVKVGLLPVDQTTSYLKKLAGGHLLSDNDLLKHVACHDLKEMDSFVVADHFKVGRVVGDIPIVRINPLFLQLFGDVVEYHVPARRVSLWNLVKALSNEEIFEELGWQRHMTSMYFGHLFQLMELGLKSGCRLDNHANVRYAHVPKSKIPRPEPRARDGLNEKAIAELQRTEAEQQAAYDRLPETVICTLQWHVYTQGDGEAARKGIHISASLPDQKTWSVHDQVAL